MHASVSLVSYIASLFKLISELAKVMSKLEITYDRYSVAKEHTTEKLGGGIKYTFKQIGFLSLYGAGLTVATRHFAELDAMV